MGKQDMVAWQPSDDLKIFELVNTLGPRWSSIAASFPGRTVSSIRNRYLRLNEGKKIRSEGKITKNRCQHCGEPKKGHICKIKLEKQQQQNQHGAAITLASLAPAAASCPNPIPQQPQPLAPPPPVTTEEEDDESETEHGIPVAAAVVAVAQQPVLPSPNAIATFIPSPNMSILSALPAHMVGQFGHLIKQPAVGLPVQSPLTVQSLPVPSPLSRDNFYTTTFEPESMMNTFSDIEDGVGASEAASQVGVDEHAGPRGLMVDIARSSEDEREGPPTPAAA